jgi:uncharacterized protein DUF992
MRCGQLVLSVAIGVATASIAEEPRTTIGVLTCTLVGAAEQQPANQQQGNMRCGFKPTGAAAEEKYSGTVRGLAQAVVGKQVLVWSVIGPAAIKASGGLLAQRYARAKVAAQPPSWVGEKNSAIVLQFETQGSEGAGNSISQIDLELTGTSA